MSEAAENNSDSRAESAFPIRILGQFVKDLSFEVPMGSEIFGILRENTPEIPVSFDVGTNYMGSDQFLVTVGTHIEARVADKTAFILELQYNAVIQLDDMQIPRDRIHPLMLIEVPRLLFPFIRQIIADLTVNGGFPPLFLQLVDFAELYRQRFALAGQVVEPPAEPPPTIN